MRVVRKWSILAVVMICLVLVLVPPQTPTLAVGEFVDSGLSFLGVHYSAADWGDYDNDGDLDLALVGEAGNTPSFKLYANQNNGSFREVLTGIPGRTYANVGWVDYNNDGQLDLLVGGSLTGYGPGGVVSLYRNDAGTFREVSNTPFVAASTPTFDWADYDGDGDRDLLLAGRINVNYGVNVTRVYRNNGDDTFTELKTNLVGISWGVAAWVDYDNDGKLDIFLTGCPDGDGCTLAKTQLYYNTGAGAWAEVTTPFMQVGRSGADWGDYDNDGDLDLILLGSHQVGRLYRNNGNGTFQDTGLSFPKLHEASAQWADYNDDGFLDLTLSGMDSSVRMWTHIYRNNRNGTFTDIQAGLTGVCIGGLAWGDYDNDQRLDLLVTGCDGHYCPGTTRLYRNTSVTAMPTATSTPTSTPTLIPTSTPTSTPTSVPTELPTSTPTSMPTGMPMPTATPTRAPMQGVGFLPMISNRLLLFLAAVNPQAIPSRPATTPGEVYYSTAFTVYGPLPSTGRFYFSSAPDHVEAIQVDDELAVLVNGQERFTERLSQAAVVEISRAELEQWIGQSVVVEFRDVGGGVVASSPIWLIWVP